MNTPVLYRRFETLLGWDPMRLLDDLMTWQPPGSELVFSAATSPLNMKHTDDGVTITVDMPGVDAKDLDLTIENANLSITGKRGDQTYRYSVALGDTTDPNNIEAQLDKGVLTVHAHKRPETNPRKILVGGASQKALDSGESAQGRTS
jgi:HSP20 family molecular chaperone IbpA